MRGLLDLISLSLSSEVILIPAASPTYAPYKNEDFLFKRKHKQQVGLATL